MDTVGNRTELLARWRGGEFGSVSWEDVKVIARMCPTMDILREKCLKLTAHRNRCEWPENASTHN